MSKMFKDDLKTIKYIFNVFSIKTLYTYVVYMSEYDHSQLKLNHFYLKLFSNILLFIT